MEADRDLRGVDPVVDRAFERASHGDEIAVHLRVVGRHEFERIADHVEKIDRFALEPNASVSARYADDLSELGSETRRVVDNAADAVLTDAGIETANAALEKHQSLLNRIEELDRELYDHDVPNEAYMLGLLLDSLRRSAEYGVNVASVAIQQISRQNEQC